MKFVATLSLNLAPRAINKSHSFASLLDVTVSDVSFLWAGLANGVFGRNIKETTSDIAKENNAIFAINGDFYGRKNIS